MDDAELREWGLTVRRIAVFTGAGISTDSGVPDYRGPSGVWTRDPALAEAFTYDRFMADSEVRARFWRTYLRHAAWRAEPNAAHHALAQLDRAGFAVRILTQNVDGLHQMTGIAPRKVLELHGSMRTVVCTDCAARSPAEQTIARVAAGDPDPACPDCGGILKLAVVLFGQHLDAEVFSQAEKIAQASQLMLVVGSSLLVEPAASLCLVGATAGARLVVVNRDPTPYDGLADTVIREPIGTALPRIADALTAAQRA